MIIAGVGNSNATIIRGLIIGSDMGIKAENSSLTENVLVREAKEHIGFPAPTGEFTNLSAKQLKNTVLDLSDEIKKYNDEFKKKTCIPPGAKYEELYSILYKDFRKNYIPRAILISSEIFKRTGNIYLSADQRSPLWNGAERLRIGEAVGVGAVESIYIFLNFLSDKLPNG